jgi:hypothetical protein
VIREKKPDGPGWTYRSFELDDGDREIGYEYLIPSPKSGEVRKEPRYIPLI